MPEMSEFERDQLLAEVHVAVISVARLNGSPLTIPLWYEHRDGEFLMDTDTETLHARLLRAWGRATLTVQDEPPPYRYVSGEGSVEFLGDEPRVARRIAARYIGEAAAEGFVATARPLYQLNAQTLVLRPDRIWAAQFPSG